MTEDLDSKLERLLKTKIGSSKKSRRGNSPEEWHVYYIAQSSKKNPPPDFQKRHIFYPSQVPPVGPNEMVVLHRHPMYDMCKSKYGCHEVNFPHLKLHGLYDIWKDLYENDNSTLRFS